MSDDILPFKNDQSKFPEGMVDGDEHVAVAARRALIEVRVAAICVEKAESLVHFGQSNHPVIFLCDKDDLFGMKYFKLFFGSEYGESTAKTVDLATKSSDPLMALACFGVGLSEVKEHSYRMSELIYERMNGLIGYFPVIVCAHDGYTVFPWPFSIKWTRKPY